ncbi:acetyl-CoA synthetase-like protein [Cyathus striatus]|nr:acetyl-CoA synthetase-like protein [Cyathus striatus]
MVAPLEFLRDITSGPDNVSLGDVIAARITTHGHISTLLDCLCSTSRPAIYSPDFSRPPLSHGQLRSFISSFALPHSEISLPFSPNDRVMIVLPSGPENAVALLSIACYHTCAPVNESCTAAELKEDVIRLGVKAIITTKASQQRLELKTLQDELNCDVIFVEGRSTGPAGLFDMSLMQTSQLSRFRGLPSPSQPHKLADISLILHTSGTSGKKKVVPYPLRTLIIGTWSVVQSWNLREDDINMNMMPLFHVGGIVRNLLAPILSGGSAIMSLGFDATAFWNLAQEFQATWYYAAPTIHHAILSAQPDSINPKKDLNIRMVCNAAGGLLPSLATQLKETFGGAIVLPSYGMTECMPIATPPVNYQLDRPGCSGIACGPHLSIRDPRDIECALLPMATGAICVRGLPAFSGYEVSLDPNVSLDRSMFSSEGWFDSGDIGYLDEDGYLYITGRSKEIINKGGEVVSPFEVEEAISTAAKDYIKNVLAFSIEHDVLQEAIGIVVVPVPNKPRIGLQQLHDMLRDHLHPSKWPFAVVYMQDLPKNSTGKSMRINLSTRLGFRTFTDSVSFIDRHFEAETPNAQSSHQDPIPSRRVVVDLHAIEVAIASLGGVESVAIHSREGSTEAYISARDLDLDSAEIKRRISQILPGYTIPDALHVLSTPLYKDEFGNVDFARMEEEIVLKSASLMTPNEVLLRGIISDLLNIEPVNISPSSDFFLLGGNSLLVGKLAYQVRKQAGVNISVPALFMASTVSKIATLIEVENDKFKLTGNEKQYHDSTATFVTAFTFPYDYEAGQGEPASPKSQGKRGQTHPLVMIIQALPFIFFYPLKTAFTWVMILYLLVYLSQPRTDHTYFARMGTLILAMIGARLASRIVSPIAAIVFKWLVIGKYKPGTYPMWSMYHLRWWLVNQSLRSSGKGIFSIHPSMEILYYRLLGAKIGKDVVIDKKAHLREYDLLNIGDGTWFLCGTGRLFPPGQYYHRPWCYNQHLYTNIPGAVIPDGLVYGPHASSHDAPSPPSFSAYNRTLIAEPHWALQIFIAWPIIFLVTVISYLPWCFALLLMFDETTTGDGGLSSLESVIHWFSSPRRILFHGFTMIIRAICAPLVQLVLGIIVKRAFGLNTEGPAEKMTQLRAFELLGTHYEVVSIVYRAMGAKIGKHIYWPGGGIYCLDPELLDIGDNVVFGSYSELFTTDSLGSAKIVVEDGAMIADRVVLLPGTHVGRRAVMGSGALGRRNGIYKAGSTWLGNENGEAVCFSRGSTEPNLEEDDTTTPFARAFYKREANYFVYPYPLILLINLAVAALFAVYWSISPVFAAVILQQAHSYINLHELLRPSWYQLVVLYCMISVCFIIILNVQAVLAMLWVVVTKIAIIGTRKEGCYDWNKSSYNQRWQLHQVVSLILFKGYGNGGALDLITGSIYMVWYLRASGAKIGKNCSIFASGLRTAVMTEPDLVELGDNVNLDGCSVVAHINSRGNFSLNGLKIGNGSALRSGSRLLSGASMEDNSMLCEHTLLTLGEVAESSGVYIGWPAKKWETKSNPSVTSLQTVSDTSSSEKPVCSICTKIPSSTTVAGCGHVFCAPCVSRLTTQRRRCPEC